MKYPIMLLGLFVAMAITLSCLVLDWDFKSDAEKTRMVYATHCRECGDAASPGVVASNELCAQHCASGWYKEKGWRLGVLLTLAKNPLSLITAVLFFAFGIVSFCAAKEMPEWEPAIMYIIDIFFLVLGIVLIVVTDGGMPIVCFFLSCAAFFSSKLTKSKRRW